MSYNYLTKFLAVAVLVAAAGTAVNAQVFDDARDGNASSSGAAPTVLNFLAGSNIVNGTVSADASIANTRNFYTFNIGAGQELSAVNLDALTVTTNTGAASADPGFFAIIDGTTSTNPGAGFANLAGALYDPSDIGSDLLGVADSTFSGGTGFTTLGQGDYTFVIQQTGTEIGTFSLDFQVSAVAVPEPTSAIVLAGLGLVGLVRRRR